MTDDDSTNADGSGLSQLVDSNTTETNAASTHNQDQWARVIFGDDEFSEAIDGVTFTAVAVTDANIPLSRL